VFHTACDEAELSAAELTTDGSERQEFCGFSG
jgi:hypothetical protein